MSARDVAAGEGRALLVDEVALRLGILRGLSDFLARQVGPDGALICPRHKVEHTGKNVYAALIDLYNWRYTREDLYRARARAAALRAVDMLGQDPESRVPVFLPGRTDPRNASTNAIDGGACADVLATLLEEAPDLFDADEAERCRQALTLHVEGYLRHAARERPIPAQRLWAGTGTARAARLLGRDDWAEDALAGCALALGELSADGMAPYIPEQSSHCTHPALADTSSFYHSRTPGFLLYIHEILGRPLSDEAAGRVRAALDALVAMRAGDGRKVIHNEAKAWYWESDYEVASHPFDVWALHTGAGLFGSELYRDEAARAMEEWIAHINPDGGVDSHHGRGTNFQCRIFWSAHAAWIARIVHDVPLHGAPRAPHTLDLPATGLVHVERPRCTAVLRGRHRRAGNLFGCDVGGGALQSLVVHDERGHVVGGERIPRRRFRRRRPGSFLLRPSGGPGRFSRLRAVLAEDRADLRFRLYIASVEWRAGGWLRGPLYAWRHVVARSLAEAGPWLASHLDLETEQDVQGDVVTFRGGVADREGRRWPGATTTRRYAFLEDRIELTDTLDLADVQGRVQYVLPDGLTDVDVSADGAGLSRRGARLDLRARGGTVRLTVRGAYLI
ncbi:MAG: hypothetical protein ACYTG2_01310 [Planctomycetota bacterium]